MKHTNLSLFGVMGGLFLTLGAGIRYFILYPDTDKGFFFCIIGLIIIAVSWNYAGRIQLDNDIKELEVKLNCVEEFIQDNK